MLLFKIFAHAGVVALTYNDLTISERPAAIQLTEKNTSIPSLVRRPIGGGTITTWQKQLCQSLKLWQSLIRRKT